MAVEEQLSCEAPDPTPAEQYGFVEAHDVIWRLVETESLDAVDVCRGVLKASISRLRRVMPDAEIATMLYRYADEHATWRREED